jgi:hypothetical protein
MMGIVRSDVDELIDGSECSVYSLAAFFFFGFSSSTTSILILSAFGAATAALGASAFTTFLSSFFDLGALLS